MIEPQTLLIVPNKDACNAHCEFCVTKSLPKESIISIQATPFDEQKLKQVFIFAKSIGVKDVNITGGGEPLLAKLDIVGAMIILAHKHFGRVQLYTNAGRLTKFDINYLKNCGLTNITISRAHYDELKNKRIMQVSYIEDFSTIIQNLLKANLDVKLSCLLYGDGIKISEDVFIYIQWAKQLGVQKVIFRELLNQEDPNYVHTDIVEELLLNPPVPQFRGLWNQRIYDVGGVAVTVYPDGCRKDTVNHGDLIFMPDNCLYSSWNYKTSRIM